ncbi:hypothetical protein D3C73_1244400 [compost metagenome]|jgi:hypothetical protein
MYYIGDDKCPASRWPADNKSITKCLNVLTPPRTFDMVTQSTQRTKEISFLLKTES